MKTETDPRIHEKNTEFYKALEAQSIDRMEPIWLHEQWVSCVHPGWNLLSGWEEVRESWQKIFTGTQKMRVSPAEVNVLTSGDVAWVTCVENITVFDEDSFDSMQAIATNVYIHKNDDWKLVHHHASPIPAIIPESLSEMIQ